MAKLMLFCLVKKSHRNKTISAKFEINVFRIEAVKVVSIVSMSFEDIFLEYN